MKTTKEIIEYLENKIEVVSECINLMLRVGFDETDVNVKMAKLILESYVYTLKFIKNEIGTNNEAEEAPF